MFFLPTDWLQDPGALAALGRSRLCPILQNAQSALSLLNLTPPDPNLPDSQYFPALAQLFATLHLQTWISPSIPGTSAPTTPFVGNFVGNFVEQSPLTPQIPSPVQTSTPLRSSQQTLNSQPSALNSPIPLRSSQQTLNSQPSTLNSLTKSSGYWSLTFHGQHAVIKHQRGLFYVAWLLYHQPDEPLHALDLIAKIPQLYRQQLGITSLTDQATGQTLALDSHSRLQERSLALDDAEALRRLYKKQLELEAILDDPAETEPVKAEALRELEELTDFQRRFAKSSTDSSQKAVRAVRRAITRLHQHLASETDHLGQPHPVLRAFAHHLHTLLQPRRPLLVHSAPQPLLVSPP